MNRNNFDGEDPLINNVQNLAQIKIVLKSQIIILEIWPERKVVSNEQARKGQFCVREMSESYTAKFVIRF